MPRLLAEGLAERGHDVHLVTSGRGRGTKRYSAAGAEAPGPVHHHVVDHPADAHAAPHARPGPHGQWRWQRAAAAVIATIDQEAPIDVVHHVGPLSLSATGWLAPTAPPTVLGPVLGGEVAPGPFVRYLADGQRREALHRHVTRRMLPRVPVLRRQLETAGLALAATPETARLVATLGARHIEVEPAIALPRQPMAPLASRPDPEDPLNVVWLGPVRGGHSIALAIAIVAEVDVRVPVHLRVVGAVPADERVERLLRRPGMYERVESVGPMGADERAKLLTEADVVLSTSLRSADGLDVARAMAAGVPVVALDHQVGSHLLRDGGGVRLPVTRPAIVIRRGAQALGELYLDRAHARRLGAEGRVRAEELTESALLDRMERNYAEVTRRGGGR